MKNNETGETELVLGNKQLLSFFFLAVVLFAVFFVMGYIVGRNSTPVTQASANRDPSGAVTPSNARPDAGSGSPPAPRNTPSAPEQPKPDPDANPPAGQATDTKPAVEPAPGETFLQVTAVKPDVAETVAKTLKDKGFPTVLSPGPAGRTRVLVGPYADLSKLGQAKAELERLGFSPFVKK